MSGTAFPSLILGIKQFFLNGFRAFPLVLGVTAFILAFFQTNIAFILLFTAIAFAVPLATILLNLVLEFIITKTSIPTHLWQIPVTGACTIVGSGGLTAAPTNIFALPTFWLASVVFFFSYLAINGISLYNRDSEPTADESKVSARKMQALMGAILAIITGLAFIIIRVTVTGCESVIGIVTALLTMTPLAYGWYRLAAACGADRLVDLFGIANGLLPMSAKSSTPYVCVKDVDPTL